MTGESKMLFVFNKEKAANKKWIQFNLREFGLGTGNQNFRFKVSDLELQNWVIYHATPDHCRYMIPFWGVNSNYWTIL